MQVLKHYIGWLIVTSIMEIIGIIHNYKPKFKLVPL